MWGRHCGCGCGWELHSAEGFAQRARDFGGRGMRPSCMGAPCCFCYGSCSCPRSSPTSSLVRMRVAPPGGRVAAGCPSARASSSGVRGLAASRQSGGKGTPHSTLGRVCLRATDGTGTERRGGSRSSPERQAGGHGHAVAAIACQGRWGRDPVENRGRWLFSELPERLAVVVGKATGPGRITRGEVAGRGRLVLVPSVMLRRPEGSAQRWLHRVRTWCASRSEISPERRRK